MFPKYEVLMTDPKFTDEAPQPAAGADPVINAATKAAWSALPENSSSQRGVSELSEAPAPDVDPTTALLELLTRTENERDDLKDRLLRTLAEMENLRRRTEREVADARIYAMTQFARDMMSVPDNIRRALDTIPEPTKATQDTAIKALLEGIELTERDLLKTFERHGIRQINPMGEKFDPNLHQAMFEAPDPSLPNGHVMNVAQIGYTIGERVLRPALVGVARGGLKVVNTSTPPQDNQTGESAA
jgi:molecular chaperone GrpE